MQLGGHVRLRVRRRSTANCHDEEESEGICMKRFHAHVRVDDLESSVRFYSMLFGTEPAILKADYAKWMLEDPSVNFAITSGSSSVSIDHLGLQVESDGDLAIIAGRFDAAGLSVVKQENAACCYARGNKGWVSDPSGISWETFHTFAESTVYGNDIAPRPGAADSQESGACCAPAPSSSSACCSVSKAL
jgi:extradiol dioxygenase family protein